jgi:hypothetical protein
MLDHFRELEIMRGARCVQGDAATYVELPNGAWEEHCSGGGMRGVYPLRGRAPAISPQERTATALRGEGWVVPPRPARRPWWEDFKRGWLEAGEIDRRLLLWCVGGGLLVGALLAWLGR